MDGLREGMKGRMFFSVQESEVKHGCVGGKVVGLVLWLQELGKTGVGVCH